jgi:hypothetical protein
MSMYLFKILKTGFLSGCVGVGWGGRVDALCGGGVGACVAIRLLAGGHSHGVS